MMFVSGYPVFICWFYESTFFRRMIFIFLIFEISFKFSSPQKIFKLLVYYIFIDSFFVSKQNLIFRLKV